MLAVIQIIALVQGIFLASVLFQRRKEYEKLVFWLFMGCIASVILFSIGDDDYNLIVPNANWFFFHEALMITFFFLFIRYSHSTRKVFEKSDSLFFLPYLLNIFLQIFLDLDYSEYRVILRIGVSLTELSFIGMLVYSIYDILKNEKERWLLTFVIPFTLLYTIDEITNIFDIAYLPLDSYGIFLMAIFLFYFATYKLITSPKEILPSIATTDTITPIVISTPKYRLSNLSESEIETIKKELNRLMTEDKLFKNPNLNANQTAQKLGITRQRLSEVLNVHIDMRFQDFLNQYRVEEFIKCLHQEAYQNLTLLGIATEVGFRSKSTFNAAFKKFKGMTPSQYKKQAI